MNWRERSPSETRFETLSVTCGEKAKTGPDAVGDVTVPIHLSSTFAVEGIDPEADLLSLDPDANEYVYSRLSNPTRNAVEKRLAALEGGDVAFAFASGTAAIATVAMATLTPGDHVVAFDDLYGGTKAMFTLLLPERLGVDVTFVDARDPENVRDAMQENTRLVWMESPTNPLLHLCDVAAIADIAHEHGALLGVDNTFLSPYFQQPLALGADVVVHSTTKYLNGHSDSMGGVAITNDPDLTTQLTFLQQIGLGNMLSPFDSYLLLRGIKTLPMRMRQHAENAQAVAQFLETHELVERVYFPGLNSHPQADLAHRQMSGPGGVVTAVFKGDLETVEQFVAELDEFTFAVSLGGVESLVEHPATLTHSELTPEERENLGITDTLLRFSVGVEHEADLLADLESALDAVRDRVVTTAD
ncbi:MULTISPECIES: PLP-dependent aspartate aminotransferase family protein [unclassified Haladaptatus]|uniref:trans-sulfuration enzyme family protein n=1 Tax=unclassified Haladaptatus TaxID=2622732 RepID=UPI0023E88D0A|nr:MULTISPECIES: aminotransferase class I/II-fold pyridoxal phosphate-dependent enzyme [unclassified Haladaptatus]